MDYYFDGCIDFAAVSDSTGVFAMSERVDSTEPERVAHFVLHLQGERVDLDEFTIDVVIRFPSNPPPNPQLQPLRTSLHMSPNPDSSWDCPTDLKVGDCFQFSDVPGVVFTVKEVFPDQIYVNTGDVARDTWLAHPLNWNKFDAQWRRVPAPSTTLSAVTATAYGCHCTGRCGQFYPDTEARADFVCWECRNFG